MSAFPSVAEQELRRVALSRAWRDRPLSIEEQAELDWLETRRANRIAIECSRIRGRIKRTRDKLAQLEARASELRVRYG